MSLSDLLRLDVHSWLGVVLGAALAAAAALVLHAFTVPVLRRLLRFSVPASTVLEGIVKPTRLVLPLAGLQFVWDAAPAVFPGLHAVQLATALLLTFALTWTGVRAIGGFAEGMIRRHPVDVADNLAARRLETQARVLARTVMFFVVLIGVASALMQFPSVRQFGASLLASAGLAGLAAGIAARPVLANLIAGLQIGLSQPLRLDDVVIIQGEWGRIEEITMTYVVVRIWDERRLVVPLQWIIENPFQNWTRTSAQLLGTVLLWVDYRVPLAPLRAALEAACKAAPEWDGRLASLQVVDTSERAMQVRCLVSAADAGKAWDLRCRVRERLIDFLQREHPDALPRLRAEIDAEPSAARQGDA
jgi:small-conductance mechanosensitive channel